MKQIEKKLFATLAIANLVYLDAWSQIASKDVADKAVSEILAWVPFLKIITILIAVIALIVAGFMMGGENANKPKIIGTVMTVLIIAGLAYWAVGKIV